MDEVLLFLLHAGAARRPVRLTTAEVGLALGMTQQNASRRLLNLEKEGFIKKMPNGILIAEKGICAARKTYAVLKEAFEGSVSELRGVLRSGLGEGRYYLSLEPYKKIIKNALNFVPYPGTFNLEIDENDIWKRDLLMSRAIVLPSFEADGRRYGGMSLYPCFVDKFYSAIVFPERTHHKNNIVELISNVNLRKRLKKKDGDRVVVRLGVFK